MSTVRIAEGTTTLLLPSPAPPVSCKICLLDSSTEINAVQNDKKKLKVNQHLQKSIRRATEALAAAALHRFAQSHARVGTASLSVKSFMRHPVASIYVVAHSFT